jgi:hypothetical protein
VYDAGKTQGAGHEVPAIDFEVVEPQIVADQGRKTAALEHAGDIVRG